MFISGPPQGSWLNCMHTVADLTPDPQVFLSWGVDCHDSHSLSISSTSSWASMELQTV